VMVSTPERRVACLIEVRTLAEGRLA